MIIEPVNLLELRALVAPSHSVSLQMYFNFGIVLMFKVTDETLVVAAGGFDVNADKRLRLWSLLTVPLVVSMVVVMVVREAAAGPDTARTATVIRRLADRDTGSSLGRLEVGSQGVVAAIPVPRNLNCKELYFNGDHRVLLRVVLATVQPQQAAQTVILNILESLAEFYPLFLCYFICNIIFNKFIHV